MAATLGSVIDLLKINVGCMSLASEHENGGKYSAPYES